MRVIQDSDDDLDDDLEADMLPQKDVGAFPMQATNNEFSQPDTSSTDSMKRAFELAHRTYLQSHTLNPNLSVEGGPPSSAFIPKHTIKRQDTSVQDSPPISPSEFSYNNHPIGHEKMSSPVLRSPSLGFLENGPQTSKGTAITEKEIWNLEGTMRNEYAQHNPMMMFPEPSSTIPNATFTQQRMLEAVAAPTFLGIDVEIVAPYEPEPSIPWSEYLRLTPGDRQIGEQLESSEKERLTSQVAPTSTPVLPLAQISRNIAEQPMSQHSHQESPVLLRGSPLRNEILSNGVEPAKSVVLQSGFDTSFRPDVLFGNSTNTHRSMLKIVEKPLRRPKSQSSLSRNPEDDTESVEAPKEQFKSHPSHSRSLRVDVQEPIDYSIKPKKASRTRSRRTANGASGTDKDAAPEKVQQICDMGFSPSATKKALLQNNGDLTQTIEWLVTNRPDQDDSDHDELAPQSSPKSKTKLKRKTSSSINQGDPTLLVLNIHNTELELSHLGMSTENPTKLDAAHNGIDPITVTRTTLNMTSPRSPKVQVVIPQKLLKPALSKDLADVKTAGRKPKRRKTTLDHPEPIAEESITSEVTAGKKRGRGRPKKVADIPLLIEFVPEEEGGLAREEKQFTVLQSVEFSNEHLQRQSSIFSSVALVPNDNRIHQRPEVEPFTPPPLRKATPKFEDSRTPERSIKPACHSPINKGKVPYRVGLSKRARIAPLLRILKK